VAGVIEIEVNTAAVTVKVAEPLIAPEVAVMVVLPGAKLVASPPVLAVAIEIAEEVQVEVEVSVCVVPLL
jgi:hypothetical protein